MKTDNPKRILIRLGLMEYDAESNVGSMRTAAQKALRKQAEEHWLTSVEEETLHHFVKGTAFEGVVEELYNEVTTTGNIAVIPMPFGKAKTWKKKKKRKT